ncbi:hypothetical protein N7520_002360 [Penicillium odoratum]|uniref:uncharacterized protein n=1 Tax=Penicillium odoratum TaxID=1167516 RepID=UPI0025473C5C|nr:uncharacterized protein N7520_002360 [Penicillium odoratum]KAJ5771831.1 hypothetical protein N7520_002360 [Penicillium odoratum]
MIILTWMYNYLGGADEDCILRNVISAAGFICHGSGSKAIAAGYGEWQLNTNDTEGDTARSRRTFPIIYGDQVARFSVAVGSVICPRIWCLESFGYLILLVPGALIAYRTPNLRSMSVDELSYKFWCVWLIIIHMLLMY